MSTETLHDVNAEPQNGHHELLPPPTAHANAPGVPYYALSEKQVREQIENARTNVTVALVEAERRKRADLEAGKGKQAPLFLFIEGEDGSYHKEGLVEDPDKARVMAEAEAPYRERAARLWRRAEQVHDTIVDPTNWVKAASQPVKIAKYVGRAIKAEHVLDRGWNAAIIAGIRFERMLEAATPYVPKIEVTETVSDFLDQVKTRQSLETDIAPDRHAISHKTETLVQNLKLDAQLAEQLQILMRNGILKQLPSGEVGIVDSDGKEYPAPTPATIRYLVEQQHKLIEHKASQGFNRMLLVPEAVSAERQAEAFKQDLADRARRGLLHDAYGEAAEIDSDLLADNDETELLGTSDTIKQLRTKSSKSRRHSIAPGWRIVLVKNMPELPARTQDVVSIGGRGEFVSAKRTGARSQELLDKSPVCYGEQGLSLDAWLAYASTELQRTNTIIDFHGGTFLLGSETPGYIWKRRSNVPWIGWQKKYKRSDMRQLDLGASPPRLDQQNVGVRTMVEIS